MSYAHLTLQILQGEGVAPSINNSDEPNFQCSSDAPELNKCTSGNSDNWMVLSVAGDKPTPRFNVRHSLLSMMSLLNNELLQLIGPRYLPKVETPPFI